MTRRGGVALPAFSSGALLTSSFHLMRTPDCCKSLRKYRHGASTSELTLRTSSPVPPHDPSPAAAEVRPQLSLIVLRRIVFTFNLLIPTTDE